MTTESSIDRAVHSSPPIRTRPACPVTSCTTYPGLPTSASVPNRVLLPEPVRWRRATGASNPTPATAAPENTTNCTGTGSPSAAANAVIRAAPPRIPTAAVSVKISMTIRPTAATNQMTHMSTAIAPSRPRQRGLTTPVCARVPAERRARGPAGSADAVAQPNRAARERRAGDQLERPRRGPAAVPHPLPRPASTGWPSRLTWQSRPRSSRAPISAPPLSTRTTRAPWRSASAVNAAARTRSSPTTSSGTSARGGCPGVARRAARAHPTSGDAGQRLPLAHPGPAVDHREQRGAGRRGPARRPRERRLLGQDRVGADQRDVLGPRSRRLVEAADVREETGGGAVECDRDVGDDARAVHAATVGRTPGVTAWHAPVRAGAGGRGRRRRGRRGGGGARDARTPGRAGRAGGGRVAAPARRRPRAAGPGPARRRRHGGAAQAAPGHDHAGAGADRAGRRAGRRARPAPRRRRLPGQTGAAAGAAGAGRRRGAAHARRGGRPRRRGGDRGPAGGPDRAPGDGRGQRDRADR